MEKIDIYFHLFYLFIYQKYLIYMKYIIYLKDLYQISHEVKKNLTNS